MNYKSMFVFEHLATLNYIYKYLYNQASELASEFVISIACEKCSFKSKMKQLFAKQIALLRGCVSNLPQAPSEALYPAVSPNVQHGKMIIRMNCDLRESFHLVNGF